MEKYGQVVHHNLTSNISLYDVFKRNEQLGVIVKNGNKFTSYDFPHNSDFFKELYAKGQIDFTSGYNIEDNTYCTILSTFTSLKEAYDALVSQRCGGLYVIH